MNKLISRRLFNSNWQGKISPYFNNTRDKITILNQNIKIK